MSRRPNLFIIGAPKCGTTAMTRYLEAHPDIFVAPRKDLHHFGSDLDFRSRPHASPDAYHQWFVDASTERWVCDSSVWYMYSQCAAAEIHASAPDARIIAMLRHPVDAMYALWGQLRLNGLGDEDITDFEDALAAESARRQGQRLPATTPLPSALFYRAVVSFSGQLQRYFDIFGADAVQVVIQEEMKADTEGTVAAIYEWLSVNAGFRPELKAVNTSKAVRSEGIRTALRGIPSPLKSLVPSAMRKTISGTIRKLNSTHAAREPLSASLRQQLCTELGPEISRIEETLGRTIPSWHVQ